MRDDPEEVAFYADYPTVHQDLTARHKWLIQWGKDHRDYLSEDPDWYDAKAAGWWAWGASLWIGHGWCHPAQGDGRPLIQNTSGGRGISAQVIGGLDRRSAVMPSLYGQGVFSKYPGPRYQDSRPFIQSRLSRQGISAQVLDKIPYVSDSSGTGISRQCGVADKIPYLGAKPGGRVSSEKRPRIFGKDKGGIGVSRQRENVPRIEHDIGGCGVNAQREELRPRYRDTIPRIGSEIGGQGTSSQRARAERLLPWFMALSERLHAVIVLNRQWKSALTPTILADTPSSPGFTRAIFLDPPYLLTDRRRRLYPTDAEDPEAAAARESWQWALDNGHRKDYRIAYCCRVGDFYFPETWECVTNTMSGIKRPDRRHRLEAVYFSPSCNRAQGELF